MELVAEHIQENWSSETRDDTNDVYESVKEVDFSIITDAINEKIANNKCYYLDTEIEIIPDTQ